MLAEGRLNVRPQNCRRAGDKNRISGGNDGNGRHRKTSGQVRQVIFAFYSPHHEMMLWGIQVVNPGNKPLPCSRLTVTSLPTTQCKMHCRGISTCGRDFVYSSWEGGRTWLVALPDPVGRSSPA